MRKIDKIKNINFLNEKIEKEFIKKNLLKEESYKPYDLYNPSVKSEFENELLSLLNKYLGIGKTNDAGTSNDNRVFIHTNLMNIINQNYPPSSLRRGKNDSEIFTNREEDMSKFLKSLGISNFVLKSV